MSEKMPVDKGREALTELCTPEFFREEYMRFREIMGSTAYTMEQKQDAFSGLAMVYLNLPAGANMEQLWSAIVSEFDRRMVYEVFR